MVDDHREIRETLARYLERHELRVTVVESAAARRALEAAAVDLVDLDIMMPGENGLALCRHLCETTGRVGGRSNAPAYPARCGGNGSVGPWS